MTRKLFIIVILLIINLGFLSASQDTLDNILSRMESADKEIKSVKFKFRQEISYTLTREKQVVTGDVAFKKPDDLYLKQDKPLEQIIVSNGKKIWVYTPSYGQVIVDTWKKWLNNGFVPSSILSFSSNWSGLRKSYSFKDLGNEDGYYVLLLMPQKKSVNASRSLAGWQLKLWIDSRDFTPRKVILEGENITVTTTTEHYVINPRLDKDLFEFRVPKGVEVMQMP